MQYCGFSFCQGGGEVPIYFSFYRVIRVINRKSQSEKIRRCQCFVHVGYRQLVEVCRQRPTTTASARGCHVARIPHCCHRLPNNHRVPCDFYVLVHVCTTYMCARRSERQGVKSRWVPRAFIVELTPLHFPIRYMEKPMQGGSIRDRLFVVLK